MRYNNNNNNNNRVCRLLSSASSPPPPAHLSNVLVTDSGASHHMFSYTALFLTLSTLPKPVPIKLGDGKIIISTHGGPAQVPTSSENLTIYALYVPAFRVSFLSVSCFDISSLHAAFANRACTIHQIQNNNPFSLGALKMASIFTRLTSNPMHSPPRQPKPPLA